VCFRRFISFQVKLRSSFREIGMILIKSVQLALCMAVSAVVASPAYASCFTIYDRHDKMVFQSPETPVDMSYQLHQTVPERFGAGASMVFTLSDDFCQVVGLDKPSPTGPNSAYSGYFGASDSASGAPASAGGRGRTTNPRVVVAPARNTM
jgi:hypothetical protein